jgi:hypothetical protein
MSRLIALRFDLLRQQLPLRRSPGLAAHQQQLVIG